MKGLDRYITGEDENFGADFDRRPPEHCARCGSEESWDYPLIYDDDLGLWFCDEWCKDEYYKENA